MLNLLQSQSIIQAVHRWTEIQMGCDGEAMKTRQILAARVAQLVTVYQSELNLWRMREHC